MQTKLLRIQVRNATELCKPFKGNGTAKPWNTDLDCGSCGDLYKISGQYAELNEATAPITRELM